MPKLEVNGTILHYHSAGEGVPIVFVHPPVISGKIFAYQTAQLADAFRVIVFDARGHGESAASRAPVTISLIAEDMKQLLDRLDIEKAFVCGYSTAGQVALEALQRYPDRFMGAVLVSAMPVVNDRDWYNRLRIRAGLFGVKWLSKPLRWSLAFGNADQRQTFKNLYHTSQHANMENAAQYMKASLEYDATDRLLGIKQPVLLLFGQKDRRFRRYANLMHERLPNSTLFFLKDQTHQIPTKSAAKMNGLIQCWIQERLNVKGEGDECELPLGVYNETETTDGQLTI